jgi:hypothetical protein
MRGIRVAAVCVTAGLLLLAVIVARGGPAVPTAPPDVDLGWEPPSVSMRPESAVSTPAGVPRFANSSDPIRAGGLVVVLGLLVLAAVLFLVLRRRRRREWAGPAVSDEPAPGELSALRNAVERARAELVARTGGPPDHAVIAAWIALEEAAGTERAPHQTATEYAGALLGHYTSDATALDELRTLYQRARFGTTPLTAADVRRAHDALERLTR